MNNSYYIEPVGAGVVVIHEHEASYRMTRAQAEANLAAVKASPERYGSDADYLRRVNFYEEILRTFEKV